MLLPGSLGLLKGLFLPSVETSPLSRIFNIIYANARSKSDNYEMFSPFQYIFLKLLILLFFCMIDSLDIKSRNLMEILRQDRST